MASQPQETHQNPSQKSLQSLSILDPAQPHNFIKPAKKINEAHDVAQFLTSKAYGDIGVFVMQLNIAMCPRKISHSEKVQTWQLDTVSSLSEPVRKLQEMLESINAIIDEVPPDTGPRRFGNVSFRKWYEIFESRVHEIFQSYLPQAVLEFGARSSDRQSVVEELTPYLLGGFGSSQRLDYGTGHELSFLAFLGCIWKLGGFNKEASSDGSLERSIVLGVIEPYLRVVRRLILTYTLEPAGSHGVWGLDDHSFLPYIFGSSQYCPAITNNEPMPVDGSLPNSPNPGDIAKKTVVDRERQRNMYFSAVGFINDVKTGPFWEHSPILFDISGVRAGWGKINKGMIKMYNGEVLSKFPVVQHFPFGSLFSWDQDPNAINMGPSVHMANQPNNAKAGAPPARPPPQDGTQVPWAHVTTQTPPQEDTRVPWANPTVRRPPQEGTRVPWANPTTRPPPQGGTRVPWANPTPATGAPSTTAPWAQAPLKVNPTAIPSTKAPWVNAKSEGVSEQEKIEQPTTAT